MAPQSVSQTIASATDNDIARYPGQKIRQRIWNSHPKLIAAVEIAQAIDTMSQRTPRGLSFGGTRYLDNQRVQWILQGSPVSDIPEARRKEIAKGDDDLTFEFEADGAEGQIFCELAEIISEHVAFLQQVAGELSQASLRVSPSNTEATITI